MNEMIEELVTGKYLLKRGPKVMERKMENLKKRIQESIEIESYLSGWKLKLDNYKLTMKLN